jgi:A/G-specific adenine glycosylase
MEQLRAWFLQEKRSFPWRQERSPYRVLISEVMLQQTQSARVILYFERWLERFPDIATLARAPLSDVLKMWEGLGYYSRARALHSTARIVVDRFSGVLPSDPDALRSLPGMGPYTTAAVLAFGFEERAFAVDANVARVLARFFGIRTEIYSPKARSTLEARGLTLLPGRRPWEVAEAFIELGACMCTPRQPRCIECPLADKCCAARNKTTHLIPVKAPRMQYEKLYREVTVIVCEDKVLLRKCPPGEIMQDLWEFPYFETDKDGRSNVAVEQLIQSKLALRASFQTALPPIAQSFTRFRVTLLPKVFQTNAKQQVSGYHWKSLSDHNRLPFSSGHKKIMKSFMSARIYGASE